MEPDDANASYRTKGDLTYISCFTECMIPRTGTKEMKAPQGLLLLRVNHMKEAIAVFPQRLEEDHYAGNQIFHPNHQGNAF